jgi:hypothetical protein
MISRSLKEHAQTQYVYDVEWIGLDGRLSTIDTANDKTVIGTNSNDDIYVRETIAGNWRHLRGKLRQVSTGGWGKFVGVNKYQRVY